MPRNAKPGATAAPGANGERPNETASAPRRRMRPSVVIVTVVLLVVGAIGLAAARQAQSEPGALFTTEQGFGMVLGTAEPRAKTTQPIVLQEGGDVQHELSHILGPLRGAKGLARGVVMRDGSAVEVTYDPDLVTEEQIIVSLRDAGYVQ